jgi:hypothetical protein
MRDIRTHWDASIASKKPGEPSDSELHERLYDRAKHNLQFFAFHASTPSPVVSSDMLSAFFGCAVRGKPFPVVSSGGIKSALDVRMPNRMLSAFLPGLPVFPEELLEGSKSIVAGLQKRGMLKVITFGDVFKELRKRPLSEEEMAACLRWWIHNFRLDPSSSRQPLLDAAVLTVGSSDNGDEQEIPLKGIQSFLDPKNDFIPMDGPLPGHLLPISVNRELDSAGLQESLEWRQLTVLEWLQYIVDPAVYTQKTEFNIVESPAWAERVLQVLDRCWATLPEVTRTTIVGLLDKLACIPTSAGAKRPREAYFSEADIFHDLPVINLPSGIAIEVSLKGMLADLGVRKHADIQLILDRYAPHSPHSPQRIFLIQAL